MKFKHIIERIKITYTNKKIGNSISLNIGHKRGIFYKSLYLHSDERMYQNNIT